MDVEYRIKEVNPINGTQHFIVEERYVNVKFLLSKRTTTLWRTVMLPDSDMEGNDCERENYNRTIEDAQALIERLKEPITKYHYDD